MNNSHKLMDGKALSAKIKEQLKEKVSKLGYEVGLAVVLVGNDPPSQIYVRNKIKACEETGIKSFAYYLPGETSQEQLNELIDTLNNDPKVHGILIQLPLPKRLNEREALERIVLKKDVECLSRYNAGRLLFGENDVLPPCTPAGVMELIKEAGIELEGKHAVVIGRSNIVGKPLALLLLNANCTVTIAHSRTKDLSKITKEADIVVCAVGKLKMLKADMIKEGAVVIDVGINRVDGKVYGDADFDDLIDKVSYITPVPGGVGPMTIAMLLKNTVTAAERAR